MAQEKANIDRKLQPIRDTWKRKDCQYVRTDSRILKDDTLINIMGASSGGSIFLKSINYSGVVKDGGYIVKLFIEDVDPKKCRSSYHL